MDGFGTDLGIIITASHNPPEYNGFKLKGSFGGPLQVSNVAAIEALIPDKVSVDLDHISLETFERTGLLEYVDLETMYCKHVEQVTRQRRPRVGHVDLAGTRTRQCDEFADVFCRQRRVCNDRLRRTRDARNRHDIV